MSDINFYFSIGSTYTYLSVTRILDVEKKHKVKFNWMPFSVRAIMKEMNNIPFPKDKKNKVDYMWRDIERRAEGYGFSEDDGAKFYIIKPHNKENATAGNGTMVALAAQTKEAVDKFHKTALENGAIDEGAPGPRSDGNYYGYVRDHDGNKITARCVLN